MTLGFIAGAVFGGIVVRLLWPVKNTCVCSVCRQMRGAQGKDIYGEALRGTGDGRPWRPGL